MSARLALLGSPRGTCQRYLQPDTRWEVCDSPLMAALPQLPGAHGMLCRSWRRPACWLPLAAPLG